MFYAMFIPQKITRKHHQQPIKENQAPASLAEAAAYQVIRLVVCAMGILPREWGLSAGAFLGRLAFRLDRRHREVAMNNLRYAYGIEMTSEEVRETALKVFENFGKVMFEVCWSWQLLGEKKLFNYFRVEGLDNMRKAILKNRGVLALTGHFGNWELLSVLTAVVGQPVSTVYRPLDFSPLNRFIEDFRLRFGCNLIHRRKAIRTIMSALKNGEVVSVLLDQGVDWYEGVFVDFFGHRACTNQAMARLALKTNAPVVPVFLIREEKCFTATFLPEVPLIRTGDPIKDVEVNTENYNRAIESIIRRYPDQWFWVHRRWKNRPYLPWHGPSEIAGAAGHRDS